MAKRLLVSVGTVALVATLHGGCGTKTPRSAAPAPAAPTAPTATERAAKPHMKGTELYSWREETSGAWFFSLLIGTNRAKTVAQVMAEETRIEGIPALKEKLSGVAEGEHVFWRDQPTGGVPADRSNPLSYPSAEVVDEVLEHCERLGIVLDTGSR